jgi:hypothetical protein
LAPTIAVLDEAAARAVGRLCAQAGASDVVDASVVLTARVRGDRVVTGDLAAIDPALELLVV